MNTLASSTPRGTAPTSSASAPASSSPLTASVIKFRCLYTHDLRRKSKRWQDGYLRYHAFNKRVMVYDETGNYIGDHHWRSNDEVQDGDEMELDKGALIQVGERVGTTQTDLSNLLEKRKSTQGSPQANDPASQAPRASAPIRSSGSSQPFRSLNELLGIKKTPFGHLVSPYEERHPPTPAANAPESSERAPKRQKVSSVEKAPVNKRNIQSQVVDLTIQEDEPSTTRAANVAQGRKTPRETHRAAELPKKDLDQKNQSSSVIRSRNVPEASELARPDTSTFAKHVVPTPKPSRNYFSKPVPHVAPSDSRNEQLEALRTASIATKPKPRETPQETPREPARPQQGLGQKQPTLPEDIPQKAAESPNPTRSNPPTFVKPALPSSLEPSNSRPLQPVPSAAAKDGRSEQSEDGKADSGTVPPTDKPTPKLPRGPVNTLRISSGKPRRKLMYSALLPGDASQGSIPELAPSSPGSRSQPLLKSEDSQPDTAPLQEVESTNAEFMPSDSTQFILDEMIAPNPEMGFVREATNLATIHQNPLQRRLPTKRALDAPFRKSLSDPSALTTVQTRPTLTRSALSAVPEQHEPVEAGPWTSEALDLFDFWPPGQPKPSCVD